MRNTMRNFTDMQVNRISEILADTQRGLTNTEIDKILHFSGLRNVKKNGQAPGVSYRFSETKRLRLFNCFMEDINETGEDYGVMKFVESALNPVLYTTEDKREKYKWMFEEINKVLLLVGMELGSDGKLRKHKKVSSLDEVDKRVNSLRKKMLDRRIHAEVEKYCKKDLMRKDYYDVIFEASKGLADRVRKLSGLHKDGGELFQEAFAITNPLIVFNKLESESEKSEHKGLRELLESIFHLVRNPVAHTPKIHWTTEEDKVLDVLTLISFAHKYLDECIQVPKFKAQSGNNSRC